jgi:hypothetical protein
VGGCQGITFNLTKEGWFQPSPEFTEKYRVPFIKFTQAAMAFLDEFKKDPFGIKKKEEP